MNREDGPGCFVVFLMFIAGVFVLFAVLDRHLGTVTWETGEVLALSHTPSSIDVGTGTDSDGHVVVTTTHHSEKFSVVVSVEGIVGGIEVPAATLGRCHVGENVMVKVRTGKWTGRRFFDGVSPIKLTEQGRVGK